METARKSLIPDLDKFLYNSFYPLSVFAAAAIFYILKLEVAGVIVLTAVILFVLVAHRDTMPALLPFLLICILPLRMYGFSDVWLKLAPLAAVIVPCLVFHFVYYRAKFKRGEMFFPYLAISLSVTLGGLFVIGFESYFSLTSLYYVIGLGFGMLGIYLLLNAHTGRAEKKYDLSLYLTKIMLWLGGFLVMMVLEYYIDNFVSILFKNSGVAIQMGNNISTCLMITMPFAFYYSKNSKYPTLLFLFGVLQYMSMALTFSRGGLICGTMLFCLCVPYGLYINKKPDRKYMSACVACLLLIAAAVLYLKFDTITAALKIQKGEARLNLYVYAIQNFKKYPIFGTGLAHRGEYYYPQQGGLYWYHSSPFQIIASLGTVGILAYSYQFIARIRLLGKAKNNFSNCALLSFWGLQIMSLVNPGEFCPLPYAFIMVLIFVVVEKELENSNRAHKNNADLVRHT